MIAIALVDNSCSSRSAYLANRTLPDFYMEDFTVMGITVESYQQASALLRQAGYAISDQPGGGEISLPHSAEILEIMHILQTRGHSATFGDVADTFYQA